MKKISRRAIVTTLLSVFVIIGLGVFVVQYLISARAWVTYPGSPHVYSSGNISTGSVRDRNGVMVLTNGKQRQYAEDSTVRMATLHLLGDREGRIEAPLINTYAEYLLDYNLLTGVYRNSDTGNILNLTLSTEACATALNALGWQKGTVGVYNYKTGEILCMVSSGTFDPDNAPSMDEVEANSYYDGVFMNRFTSATFVPGSVFKLVTAAAAIDNIPDVSQRSFNCTEQKIIDGEYITCEEYHGDISFGTGLVKSCNIIFGDLAVELGADTMTRYAQAAGVTDSLKFDGTTTAPGHFDLSGANEASLAWSGIGQYTNLINPCQFMTFVGSIANGGRAAAPYVVDSVETPDGDEIYQAMPKMLDKTMSQSTADTLSDMMRRDVTDNYGDYHFGGLTVCAKSGTAEVEGQQPNAMFAGFVRDSKYPLAFIVVVENAGSGSSVCAPIAGAVLQACAAAMG